MPTCLPTTIVFTSRPRLWLRSLLIGGLLLILLYLAAPRLYAATVIVTTTSDSGPGSLRQAIADAAPDDTITFAADLSGQTILLRSTLTLTKDVTITGSTLATSVTLSGNRATRVLAVAPTVRVMIAGLVIADGRSAQGSGLYNQGSTALDHVHFVRNRATSGGGIYNLHQLIIDNSIFSKNWATEGAWWFSYGGGINNQGYLQISNSLFAENEAANGGAIGSSTPLTITQSSFRHNRAIYGGAISGNILSVNASAFVSNQAHQFGGAINTYSTTTIKDNTFRQNEAAIGGAIRYFDDITVINSTFSANKADSGSALTNGGSMRAFGILSLYNSTFIGNEAPYGAIAAHTGFQLYNSIIAHSRGPDCSVTPDPNINNLIGDGSCAAALTGDPRLGPLQPGDDARQAYLLLPDSPAIDAGDNATCQADDQRGAPRPVDGNGDGIAACDIGAVERQPITASAEIYLQGNQHWISNGANMPDRANYTDFGQTNQPYASLTRAFVVSNLGTVDLSALRVTISGGQANAFQLVQPPGSTLMAASSSAFQIRFQSSALGAHQATVAIQGNGDPNPLYTFAITGRDCRPALTVTTNADAGPGSLRQALDDLCTGGLITFAADLSGQTIRLQQQLLLQKNLTIDGSAPAVAPTLSGNDEVRVLMVLRDIAVTLNRLLITNGRAPDGYGGGIRNLGTLTITNSTLMNNFTPFYATDTRFPPYAQGGGIYNGGRLLISNSTFTGNVAEQGGSAIFSTWGTTDTLTITHSTIRGHQASSSSVLFGFAVLDHTIITAGGSREACVGAVATSGINLIEDGSCNAPLAGDPKLGPLQNNGGGILTHALLPDSPAIDAGDNMICPLTDQRGIARPLDGNGDGVATCDLGAVEAPAVTAAPTPSLIPTPTATPSHTLTPTASPTATATPLPTVPTLPTTPAHFDVRVYVTAPTAAIHVGATIAVVVTVDNQSVGCDYPLYELTLSQLGDPIFRFDSPATVTAPLANQIIYTLTAVTPGVVALQAIAYGESFCGDFWQWRYVNGSTYPVTVSPAVPATALPTPTATVTITPSPTVTATPSATATPSLQPTTMPTSSLPHFGDGNGDQVVDINDISACIQEIFDNDGHFWQDAPGGSYPGAIGCDANADTQIDAGDVSCTALMVFAGVEQCSRGSRQGATPTTATLTIASDQVALAGSSVQIPITLTTNGAAVTAGAFRLHVDPTRLTFDPTDSDGDALPDALHFALPPLISRPLLTVTTRADTLDLFFSELAAPSVSWYDGVILTVTLRVNQLDSQTPVMTTVAFDQSVIPSLGSATGASIPVQAEDGLVQIVPVATSQRIYLPLVARE